MHTHFRKPLGVLALSIMVSMMVSGTAIAKICKTIGPDGSVTYTDRPSASCDTEAASQQLTSATEASGKQPKQNARAKPAVQSSSSASPAADAALEKAVVGVMGLEDLVQRSYAFCAGVLPASSIRYGVAADGWRERNAVAVAQSRRALSNSFDASQQRLIIEGVHLRNEQSLATVVSAPKNSQIKWCDQTVGEVDARALDVKENLKAPLSVY